MSKLQLAIVIGYVVALVPVLWCWADLGRFHRPLWVGYGNRRSWRTSLVVGYACGGWPALFVILGWLTGRTRPALSDELESWSNR